MLKYLIIAGIIWFVYNFYIKKKPLQSKNSASQKLEDNDMVECTTCKLYVAVNEAILSNGKYYCSKECLRGAK
jgi:uncharacterized protein